MLKYTMQTSNGCIGFSESNFNKLKIAVDNMLNATYNIASTENIESGTEETRIPFVCEYIECDSSVSYRQYFLNIILNKVNNYINSITVSIEDASGSFIMNETTQ